MFREPSDKQTSMSYQVLARKWRPRLFREMVGQTHVLQALINALDNNRLHHAYLFTGTRGVGKTTIARILAKCLNCEAGVTSEPCGQCASCREIDEGRFVDLIEVDAASRTKVEDTRELLDNVQYLPTRGRFKVYLIDEVHMLSGHSFNALLKTLEEPPAHVKFLLATTDPQKLPVTILSRCLQFALKNMTPEKIVEHLHHVLGEEGVSHEDDALWQLARAADGSMRDALSLTDQAIAFGNGRLLTEQVHSMLGSIDRSRVFQLVEALAAGDGVELLQQTAALAEQGADFQGVLAELLNILQRLAIAQVLPEAADNSQGDRDRLLQLAGRVSAEDVQLFYQTGLHGRRDLPLAPDPRGGFEMALLRMLAFRPGTAHEQPEPLASGKPGGISQAAAEPRTPGPQPASAEVSAVVARVEPAAAAPVSPEPPANSPPRSLPVTPLKPGTPLRPPQEPPAEWLQAPMPDSLPDDVERDDDDLQSAVPDWAMQSIPDLSEAEQVDQQDETSAVATASGIAAEWLDLFPRLGLAGLTQSIAAHCQLISRDAGRWVMHLDPGHSSLYNENHRQRIAAAIAEQIGSSVQLQVEVQAPDQETPALAAARKRRERQAEAERLIEEDPLVQQLISDFSAHLLPDSIRPLETDNLK
ncbi:DNA polymerase-3 subunit gamma/tau [Halopseudomonas yangmingensis]|uniref:DNA polymerase III subunit gamma/tau n=2 Tax=Halopseudomonas yangmingensis TaxID=1720063 RepID=A0A1I4T792_9GAMM|nr:DNA polymerase-3 subunit gamma/tau [Halopseudomonas yangmingensis]